MPPQSIVAVHSELAYPKGLRADGRVVTLAWFCATGRVPLELTVDYYEPPESPCCCETAGPLNEVTR
jgi:hypothetical protein